MKRLAVGLALGLALDPGVLEGGLWTWLFPWVLLYLLADRAAQRGGGDVKVFLVGAAFSLVYNGAYTKDMQNGFARFGLSPFGLLASPLEWGMVAVLWLHLTDAVLPRRDRQPLWASLLGAFVAGSAAVVYGVRLAYDHFPGEKFLGPFWFLYDLLFAAGAWALARAPHESVWPVVGAGLWVLAARLIAGLPVPGVLVWTLQLAWAALLGCAGWVTWRDRRAFDDEPRRADRVALTAAGLHGLSALVGFSWLSLPFDLASKLVFAYALLTRRLRV